MKHVFIILFAALLCASISHSDEEHDGFAYVTSLKGLVLRKAPSATAGMVTVIPYQGKVEIIETIDPVIELDGIPSRWCGVRYSDQSGYVFGGYLSCLEPKDVNTAHSALIKGYHRSAAKGECHYNKEIILGMSKAAVIKKAGPPKSVRYWKGNEYLVYDKFAVIASGAYSPKADIVVGLSYHIANEKIHQGELMSVLGDPRKVYYDNHDNYWDIQYGEFMLFRTRDLNDYIAVLEVYLAD